MNLSTLVQSNLRHFWRTNLSVLLGVATAVAVLAGALLVGDSVRASLRNLALARLGATDWVIAGSSFFREGLAADLQADERFAPAFQAAVPLIALEGVVSRDENSSRAGGVQVYGVDDRFWKFHNVSAQPPEGNDALVSPSLAAELGAKAGETLLLRIEKPSAIPAESLHGRKDDLGRTIRFTMREALPAAALGEFSLRPQQGSVRALFISLSKLQRNLEQTDRANVILLSAKPGAREASAALVSILRDKFRLADLGLKLRELTPDAAAPSVVSLESERAVIGDELAEKARGAASRLGVRASEILTYLANTIRANGREVPYSLVAAVDAASLERLAPGSQAGEDGIVLNQWAAADLGVRGGEEVELEYYLWQEEGRLTTQTARFRVRGIVPMAGAALDRNYAPDYPGITDTESLADWDPPFPIELSRVRPKDEDYWRAHRTTPKAFLPLSPAQKLWTSRYGKLTSIRFASPEMGAIEKALRDSLDPVAMGLEPRSVRESSLQASRGATDFGEYFTYFSFFLVVSALLLTTLFFKLGIEQRLREIGLLRALGYSTRAIRGIFLREGVRLAVLGSAAGVIGAIAYGALMMWGLRTWWVGAVGTTQLRLHIAPQSLLIGAASGIAAAMICIWWTLRRLAQASPRSLLGGQLAEAMPASPGASRGRRWMTASRWAVLFAIPGAALLVPSALKLTGQVGGFFGAGTLLLIAGLCFWSAWLKQDKRRTIDGQGLWPVSRLGFRNAAIRPGRSVLCIALIAASAFIIVSVDAFRRDGGGGALDRQSGNGGYGLLAESLLPLVHDPNSEQGRDELNLKDELPREAVISRFRLRPGDDASCLNLYQPRNPRILGATAEFLRAGRFAFQSSLASSAEEKANPWLLLDRVAEDGIVPVAADANSMTYVLHAKLGDVLTVNSSAGAPVRMRLVAALADSIFQGELLMAERSFVKHFADEEGYRVFLIDAPSSITAKTAATLEERLADFGFDVVSTEEKLAGFHQVENTYLSTFQTLGGLGLLLGTIGLGAVLLRNVLERRRELALLRAVGFRSTHLSLMVLAENALLLGCGLLTGICCALLAIAPALQARGGRLSMLSLGLLLFAVLLTGLAASIVAVRAAVRSPLIPSLRSE
ncbi:MAG: ABC transporter permease [Blastocatellia bacterium]|nr:ABC transporter permease [Blastocatellia bacterium]